MKPSRFLIPILSLLAHPLSAQVAHRVEINKIVTEVQQTPQFQVVGPKEKRVIPRYWIEIEAELEVDTTDPSKFIPELTASWFAVVQVEENGKEVSTLLSGNCVFQNIRTADKKAILSAYIGPDTLERLTGETKPSSGDFDSIALTISGPGVLTNGRYEQGLFKATKKESAKWWFNWKEKSVPDTIMPKSKTPFAWLWTERFPVEKPKE